MNEKREDLLLEDSYNNDSPRSLLGHLRTMTESGTLRWGVGYNKKTLIGMASGNDSCIVVITTTNAEVKGKGFFPQYRLEVIGIYRDNRTAFTEDASRRPHGLIQSFFRELTTAKVSPDDY